MADTRGPLVLGITWWLTSMVIIAITARFYVRTKMLTSLGADDWIMLVAVLFQIAAQSLIVVDYSWGLGHHQEDLTLEQVEQIGKFGFIFATPAIMASICARISITVLLIRIFSTKKWFHWYLIVVTTVQTILEIAVIITQWVQCKPVQGLWEDPASGAVCWDPSISQDLAYAGQAVFTLSDFTYVLFPVIMVWRLNLALRKKVGLIALFSVGIVTTAASIMKLKTAESTSGVQDAIYYVTDAVIWSSVEQSLVIIMGCVPSLRPLSKIQVSSIREYLGYSLRNLASRRTRTSGGSGGTSRVRQNEDLSESGFGNTGYQNLELGGVQKSQASTGHINPPPAAYKATGGKDGFIHRSDSYEVLYEPGPPQPTERV